MEHQDNHIPNEIPIPDIAGKKPIVFRGFIAAIGVILTIAVLVGAGIIYFKNTVSYKIGKGLQNLGQEIAQSKNPLTEKIGLEDMIFMMAEEGSHVDTRLNFTAAKLFERTIGVDTDCYRDAQRKVMRADTSVSMMNYDFAHFNFYADEDSFCFSIPELFLENMYFDNKSVVSQYNASCLAKLTGPVESEDFSISLFSEDERISLQEWRESRADSKRYEAALAACREQIVMEKVEKGVYRIILPAAETERLLRDVLSDYEMLYEKSDLLAEQASWWKEYDRLLVSDIRIVFAVNGKNRIESIRLEEPVRIMDSLASLDGELAFLGEIRSTDQVTGKIMMQNADDRERAVSFQILQTPTEDTHDLEAEIGLQEEGDSLFAMKYTAHSDALQDTFDVNLSAWNGENEIGLALTGSLDDIIRGESFALDLEELTFLADGENLCKITGDILMEPLDGEVTQTVKKETALFQMTERDWLEILYQIDEEYGGLLHYLW